ncbi:MAG: DUF2950 domain-containing protein [Planctomycetes bacterium]|nr:DUF2950 domain-containing protein [Planctomycetota bacterium]
MKIGTVIRFMAFLLFTAALVPGCAGTQQSRFASPEQATDALIQALRSNDHKQLSRILGPGSEELISSGDVVSDQNGIAIFLQQYDEKHSLTQEADGSRTLVIGDKEWPLPIPVTKDEAKNNWYFDTPAGMDEIVNRRIGRNELATIQVCLAIVDAQQEYALEDRDGNGLPDYAQKFRSDTGKKNGLYWQTAEGERPSPLGSLVVHATREGYSASRNLTGKPRPFHGYRFRMLKAQGPHAAGGEMDYVVNGKMVGGFAVVAYPAEYGASGITTFIVNQDGVVYQRDLGTKTEEAAEEMTAYDPGPEWTKVDSSSGDQP